MSFSLLLDTVASWGKGMIGDGCELFFAGWGCFLDYTWGFLCVFVFLLRLLDAFSRKNKKLISFGTSITCEVTTQPCQNYYIVGALYDYVCSAVKCVLVRVMGV